MTCRIEQIPSISAIYYALLQCGYDFYSFEREAAHLSAVRRFAGAEEVPSFFSQVRQSSCEVYPFWPRAAILETAAFFLNDAFDGFSDPGSLEETVRSSANISPAEKGPSLWKWLKGFPMALKEVMTHDGFGRYLEWEKEWIADQNRRHGGALRLLDHRLCTCREKYQPACREIRIIVNPIKCVYSSDHYAAGDAFIFTSGALRTKSVIHEYLHTIVHPLLERGDITVRKTRYPEIDASYYLDGSAWGYRNALEEYAVRVLTQQVMQQAYPSDLVSFLERLSEIN